jgi:hypothetical protein
LPTLRVEIEVSGAAGDAVARVDRANPHQTGGARAAVAAVLHRLRPRDGAGAGARRGGRLALDAELGWYAVLVPGKGWVPCPPDTPGCIPDLNRVLASCRWDRERKRFVPEA